MYVETGASLMDDVHSTPPGGAARSWRIYSLQSVLRCRPKADTWTQYAVRDQLPVQLDDGLTRTKVVADLSADAA